MDGQFDKVMRGRRKELDTLEGQIKNFVSRIDKTDGCWTWVGAKIPSGYGYHKFFSKPWKAHRLAYKLFVGDPPPELDVCHTCDNVACVNPDHLFLGTASDNMKDAYRKGRVNLTGDANPRRKALPKEVKAELVRRSLAGENRQTLAAEYGVVPYTVYKLSRRVS